MGAVQNSEASWLLTLYFGNDEGIWKPLQGSKFSALMPDRRYVSNMESYYHWKFYPLVMPQIRSTLTQPSFPALRDIWWWYAVLNKYFLWYTGDIATHHYDGYSAAYTCSNLNEFIYLDTTVQRTFYLYVCLIWPCDLCMGCVIPLSLSICSSRSSVAASRESKMYLKARNRAAGPT